MAESIALKTLGLDKQELQDRLIDALCERVMTGERLPTKLRGAIWKAIDEKIDALMDSHVAPAIEEMLAGLLVQETNTFGEPIGTGNTLREHITARAEKWLKTPVDRYGSQRDYAGDGTKPRGVFLVDNAIAQHLAGVVAELGTAIAASATTSIEAAVKSLATKPEK